MWRIGNGELYKEKTPDAPKEWIGSRVRFQNPTIGSQFKQDAQVFESVVDQNKNSEDKMLFAHQFFCPCNCLVNIGTEVL